MGVAAAVIEVVIITSEERIIINIIIRIIYEGHIDDDELQSE